MAQPRWLQARALGMLADKRVAERMRLEVTSGLELVQPCCSKQGQLEHIVQRGVQPDF